MREMKEIKRNERRYQEIKGMKRNDRNKDK